MNDLIMNNWCFYLLGLIKLMKRKTEMKQKFQKTALKPARNLLEAYYNDVQRQVVQT